VHSEQSKKMGLQPASNFMITTAMIRSSEKLRQLRGKTEEIYKRRLQGGRNIRDAEEVEVAAQEYRQCSSVCRMCA
jgi:hypothetical protein